MLSWQGAAGLLACALSLLVSKAGGQDVQTPATELAQERLRFSGHDARGVIQARISSMHWRQDVLLLSRLTHKP